MAAAGCVCIEDVGALLCYSGGTGMSNGATLSQASKIFVAGHTGLAGSAIVRALEKDGFKNLLRVPHAELDLLDQQAVHRFFQSEKPDAVVLAAARVGGIKSNMMLPATFSHENITIQTNVISSAHACGTKHLLFLASSCIYPRLAPQPIVEESLMTGLLEPTNAPYALAKLAGISLCDSYNKQHGTRYRSIMLTNLYGPHDSFDLEHAHVLPALLRRFHEAKITSASSVTLWGTGSALRDFLYVDDAATACVLLLKDSGSELLNVGSSSDISIGNLATLIAEIVGYSGKIEYDRTQPDGMPRKVLDCSKIHRLGWKPTVPLREGIERTYEWYRNRHG